MSAVTALAITAVVGAGVAAYGAHAQAENAEDQQYQLKELQKKGERLGERAYGKKFIPPKFEDNISELTAQEEYAQGLPTLGLIADRVNTYNRQARNKASGGNFGKTLRQEGRNIKRLEAGEIPGDVAERIRRQVAEQLGGAVDPAGGPGFGTSSTANLAARNLGLTSLDLMKTGMSYAPAWRQQVAQFTYDPSAAARDIFFPMSNLQQTRDQNQYVAESNRLRAEAMPDPAVAGAYRDSLALQPAYNAASQQQQAANQNLYNAGLGLVTSAAGAYAGGGGGGGGVNAYGAYGSAGAASSAAPYAAGYTNTPQGYYPQAARA